MRTRKRCPASPPGSIEAPLPRANAPRTRKRGWHIPSSTIGFGSRYDQAGRRCGREQSNPEGLAARGVASLPAFSQSRFDKMSSWPGKKFPFPTRSLSGFAPRESPFSRNKKGVSTRGICGRNARVDAVPHCLLAFVASPFGSTTERCGSTTKAGPRTLSTSSCKTGPLVGI
jgi:hypothetical protein